MHLSKSVAVRANIKLKTTKRQYRGQNQSLHDFDQDIAIFGLSFVSAVVWDFTKTKWPNPLKIEQQWKEKEKHCFLQIWKLKKTKFFEFSWFWPWYYQLFFFSSIFILTDTDLDSFYMASFTFPVFIMTSICTNVFLNKFSYHFDIV